MRPKLPPRTIDLAGDGYLQLDPDEDKHRYLVRFCGLNRDRAAIAATESVRVKLMLAHRRGQWPYPYPLPERVIIGWLDRDGWHLGRSPYAAALAQMPAVQTRLEQLLDDLLLRVALAAAPPDHRDRGSPHG
jgi:hypothetical protein